MSSPSEESTSASGPRADGASDGAAPPRTIAIMQPYLFPYPGYFHLVSAADAFVHYGEAQYRKGGYVNRNRIDVNGEPTYFTLPLDKGSVTDAIDERPVAAKPYPRWRDKLLKSLRLAYAKTPHVATALEIVAEVLGEGTADLSVGADLSITPSGTPGSLTIGTIAKRSIEAVAAYTGLDADADLIDGATVDYDRDGDAQTKVLGICAALGARRYVNAPGGRDLYDADAFAGAGLELRFVGPAPEPRLPEGFRPELSVIDALCKFAPPTLRDALSQYRLSP